MLFTYKDKLTSSTGSTGAEMPGLVSESRAVRLGINCILRDPITDCTANGWILLGFLLTLRTSTQRARVIDVETFPFLLSCHSELRIVLSFIAV
jgi:hypothetical protein